MNKKKIICISLIVILLLVCIVGIVIISKLYDKDTKESSSTSTSTTITTITSSEIPTDEYQDVESEEQNSEESEITTTNKTTTIKTNNSFSNNTTTTKPSNNSTQKEETKTETPTTTTTTNCEPQDKYKNVSLYYKTNCSIKAYSAEDNAKTSELMGKVSTIIDGSYARAEIDKCNAYFSATSGGARVCSDWVYGPKPVYDKTFTYIYGYYFEFKMRKAPEGATSWSEKDEVIASGYVKSDGSISYTTKKFPY